MVAERAWEIFEATPDAPTRARHWLAPWLPDETREAGLVVVSEIVTNALIHAQLGPRDHVGIEVTPLEERVRVTVRHRGERFTAIPRARETGQIGGWGLQLVQALSDAWGVEDVDSHGVLVWFEM
jgi:anti-sigma regulatory factor (Ser/Thr protein kinase)